MPKRVLILSDIHANLSALNAVLNRAGSFNEAWCLGDLVGYGPDPNECIDVIRNLPGLTCVLGNHDAAAIGQINLETFNYDARKSIRWQRDQLTTSSVEFLSNLPEKQVVDQVTLVHGSPRNPIWEYLLDIYSASENFDYFNTPLCFVGHTHIPIGYIASEDGKTLDWAMPGLSEQVILSSRAILNPGSVGQPRDHDSRACYAIFYPEISQWELNRVEYDIHSVQARIQTAGLPSRHAIRISEGW
jgi:diadenosine tetraphosphatase ApaH/serine/threonine PP2A family protein phosphatase